jgi:hypothetical protein
MVDLVQVDKVIIAQDSIQRFINAVSPGAYASITKIDFITLDQFTIKPLGVYGSKDEIVRLLQCMGAIDDNVYVLAVPTTPLLNSPIRVSYYLIPVRRCPLVCT